MKESVSGCFFSEHSVVGWVDVSAEEGVSVSCLRAAV